MIKLEYTPDINPKKASTELTKLVDTSVKDMFDAAYVPGIVTDTIRAALLYELNTKLMPSDVKTSGWDVREAERHGEIRALKKAIDFLP